jgi:hypothetical protein
MAGGSFTAEQRARGHETRRRNILLKLTAKPPEPAPVSRVPNVRPVDPDELQDRFDFERVLDRDATLALFDRVACEHGAVSRQGYTRGRLVVNASRFRSALRKACHPRWTPWDIEKRMPYISVWLELGGTTRLFNPRTPVTRW